MKTLCAVLGLLLLSACCCDAQRRAVGLSTSPGACCFRFSEQRLDPARVKNITKTHSSCSKEGFIVTTVKGKQICYRRNFEWAVDLFNGRQ